MTRWFASLLLCSLAVCAGGAAAHARQKEVRIGVLADLSGYSKEIGGPGAVLAVKMAVEDHHGRAGGMPVKVVAADMQNKVDVATDIARRWFAEDHVDAIADLPNTPVALAVARLGAQTNHVILVTEAASTDLTGSQCEPTTVHFQDDTHSLAAGTAKALIDQGLKKWFFITADFGFGYAMQNAAQSVVTQSGGQVLGAVRPPLGESDFSSYLLQAQASKAQVIALASVGSDATTAIKQASEFGIEKGGQQVAGLLLTIADVKALGLKTAQGLWVTEGFYWDQNKEARAFARRFAARDGGKMPTKAHAADYAAVSHYLDAIDRAGTKNTQAVMAAMRAMPIDYFGKPARLRADGRVLYDLELYRVKSPSQSHGPYDFYTPVKRIPAAKAFLPIGAGGCKLGMASR